MPPIFTVLSLFLTTLTIGVYNIWLVIHRHILRREQERAEHLA